MKSSNKTEVKMIAVPSTVNSQSTPWEAIELICLSYDEAETVDILEDLYVNSLLGREGNQQRDKMPGTTFLLVRHLQALMPELFSLYTKVPGLFIRNAVFIPDEVSRLPLLWQTIEMICMEYTKSGAVDMLEDLYVTSLLGREKNSQPDERPATTYLLVKHLKALMAELSALFAQHPELFHVIDQTAS